MGNLKSISSALMIQSVQSQILSISNSLSSGKLTLEDVGDFLPGSVMLQDIKSLTNLYMNSYGCERLHYSSDELRMMGADYFKRFFPQEEIAIIKKQLVAYLNRDDPKNVFSFYQRVKTGKKASLEWYFTTSRIYDINNQIMIHMAIPAVNIGLALNRCHYLADHNDYCILHFNKFKALSKREKEIVVLIAEGRSSTYISDLLYISIHTVNNHRKNIIRKLDVHTLAELVRFAVSYGLI